MKKFVDFLLNDFQSFSFCEMLSSIWCHLYKLKNVKKPHGRVLLSVKLQVTTLLKVTLLHGCFSRFFYIVQMVTNRATHHMYSILVRLSEYVLK